MLPCIIDERQSAFMEDRQLLHSVVVEKAKRRNKSFLVFKVDYEKPMTL